MFSDYWMCSDLRHIHIPVVGMRFLRQDFWVFSMLNISFGNLIVSRIGVILNNTKLAGIIDVRGLSVTLQRLVGDHTFISEIKREFILENYLEMI